MKNLFLFFVVSTIACATLEATPTIRVLLCKEARAVFLEARGPYIVRHKANNDVIAKASTGKRFMTHALSNGLRWGEEFPDVYAISVQPQDETTVFYVDGMQYKGNIDVYCTKKGCVTVVNDISIDEFVKSTMGVTITQPLSKEAMNALAIAYRTNAFAKVYYKEGKSLWDTTAEEANYLGLGVTGAKNGVNEAVAMTQKIVLEDKNGKPMRSIELSLQDAEALASRGLDAKRILRNSLPQMEISTTEQLAQK